MTRIAHVLKVVRRLFLGERTTPVDPQELAQRFGGLARVPPEMWLRRSRRAGRRL